MVAKADTQKSKPSVGNKVSKPQMEKKRRARINKCLDQLKSLLENYYSSSIRKRKLEKADILELTVNHLRNLQKLHSCAAAASEFPDYRLGFRRCLANVDQYLLTADNLTGSDRWTLSRLSAQLCRSGAGEEALGSTDSGQREAETREEARRLSPSAAGPEERESGPRHGGPKPGGGRASPSSHGDGAIRQPAAGRSQLAARVRGGDRSSPEKFPSVARSGDVVANIQRDVWRPW